ILGMETDVDDGEGGKLTVSEATMDKLISDYSTMIDEGEIGPDDPRYKVYMAVLAQADLANGREIIPYREESIMGGTERVEGNPVAATAADMADLYDVAKVDEAHAKLFEDPMVAA